MGKVKTGLYLVTTIGVMAVNKLPDFLVRRISEYRIMGSSLSKCQHYCCTAFSRQLATTMSLAVFFGPVKNHFVSANFWNFHFCAVSHTGFRL